MDVCKYAKCEPNQLRNTPKKMKFKQTNAINEKQKEFKKHTYNKETNPFNKISTNNVTHIQQG